MKSVQLGEVKETKGEGFALRQVLNPVTVGATRLMLFLVTIDPGGRIPPHHHGPAETAIFIHEGRGTFEVDGLRQTLGVDTGLLVPVGSTIGLENTGLTPLRFLVAMAPPITVEVCPVCGILIKEGTA